MFYQMQESTMHINLHLIEKAYENCTRSVQVFFWLVSLVGNWNTLCFVTLFAFLMYEMVCTYTDKNRCKNAAVDCRNN